MFFFRAWYVSLAMKQGIASQLFEDFLKKVELSVVLQFWRALIAVENVATNCNKLKG